MKQWWNEWGKHLFGGLVLVGEFILINLLLSMAF